MRTRAERRHNDFKKALRKKRLSDAWMWPEHHYYDNLHQYSKNKIHCSCPICTQKTNNRGRQKYYGIGSKNWKRSDLVKILRLQIDDDMNK